MQLFSSQPTLGGGVLHGPRKNLLNFSVDPFIFFSYSGLVGLRSQSVFLVSSSAVSPFSLSFQQQTQ